MKSVTLPCSATVVLALVASAPCLAGDAYPQLIELGYRADSASGLGKGRLVVIDLDGDGIKEVVVDGTISSEPGPYSGHGTLMMLRKAADGQFDMTSHFVAYDAAWPQSGLARLLRWSIDGVPHVVTLGTNQMVRIYDAALREVRAFSVAGGTSATETSDAATGLFSADAAAIGDVNADGGDELVVAKFDGIYAYSMATGQMLWRYPTVGVSDLALAQLDADPALEIIAAGQNTGLVLDGATQATDWRYIDGFGHMMTTGRFGAAGAVGWASTSRGPFTVFQSMPFSPVWNGAQGLTTSVLAPAALNGNGRDAILASDGRDIYVYDSATQGQRLRVPINDDGSPLIIMGLTGADLDGDSIDEIVFSKAASWTSASSLQVVDATTGTTRWEWIAAGGPYVATAIGDIDGDGREELVTAAQQAQQQLGALSIFDAATGRLKWRSPADWPSSANRFLLSASRIQLRPRVGTHGMDIVLAGNEYEGGRILVVDGTTLQQTLRIDNLALRDVSDLALVDYDGDGVEDFVVVSDDFSTSTIDVFSGVNGAHLWHSPAMAGRALQMLIVERSERTELVAVFGNGLRAYDRITGLLNWWLAADASTGAAYVENGVQGAEIVTLSREGNLAFHDAGTRMLLRTRTVPAPVSAAAALDGDIQTLIVASGGKLLLINGATGQNLAESAPFPLFRMEGAHLSLRRESSEAWTIVSGTQAALYRHRLVLGEHIFTSGFDSH